MMTDLAAGSRAAEQFQQDIAAAPYTQDLTQAASERKIQEDRLAKQYAPEEAAAKAERLQFLRDQERINALYAPAKAATQQDEDKYKLQEQMTRAQAAETKRLFDEAGYKKDTESDEKFTTWMSSDEGKTATDIQRLEKIAQFKFDVGLVSEGAALQKEVRARKTEDRANNIAKRFADNEILSTTDVIISNTPDDKVNETLARLPPEQLKLITDRTGVENWKNFTGKEKKEVLQRLFLSAKEQSALQLKELWAEIRESEIEARAQQKIDRDNKIKQDREEGKDSKNYQAFQRVDSSIERQNKSRIEDLDALVEKADEAMKAANKKSTDWFGQAVETERTTTTNAYNIAVQNAIDARRTSYEKRIRALKTIPDFDGKDEELESLEKELSKYPKKKETAPPPAGEPPPAKEGAAAPAPAADTARLDADEAALKREIARTPAKETERLGILNKELEDMKSRRTAVPSNKGAVGTQSAPIPFEPGKTVPENGKYYSNNRGDVAMWDESKGKMVAGEPPPSASTTSEKPVVSKEDTTKYIREKGPRGNWVYTESPRGQTKAKYAEIDANKPATPAVAPATTTAKDTSTDFSGAKSADLIREGNIDLTKRPVVKNKDGSISTVRSMSFEEDGMQILIPTVVGDKVVSDKAAIDHYRKTGEHLGMFSSVKAANAYAKKLHEEQDKMYSGKKEDFSSKSKQKLAEIKDRISASEKRTKESEARTKAMTDELKVFEEAEKERLRKIAEGE